MKLICINNKNLSLSLTVNKIYEALFDLYPDSDYHCYYIISDKGSGACYDGSYFMSLEEYRDAQLNKILNKNHLSSDISQIKI